ncbi:hypothetical protein NSIN_30174 [Nitrosotalea sinensis]|uniref:Uncharacterized protein n=1 Tax=Nitrosotalea sinensis TaxID=1499975 RepID=A0A2H1EIF6_9ARCH|nr:hypothetical protein NSIN_30174 [Candidatus Nitrosotalea sinensis]
MVNNALISYFLIRISINSINYRLFFGFNTINNPNILRRDEKSDECNF